MCMTASVWKAGKVRTGIDEGDDKRGKERLCALT